MEKTRLLELYQDVVQKLEFVEDPKKESWMPKIGENDYRSVVSHGSYNGVPAVIRVSPHEDLQAIAGDFRQYQAAANGTEALQVPMILESGRGADGIQFLIQAETPEGVRLLAHLPHSTPSERVRVAKLYWQTQRIFPVYELGEWTSFDYFLDRLNEWFTAGRQKNASRDGFITEKEKQAIGRTIFFRTNRIGMESFFNLFGNTDVVVSNGQSFIWNVRIVPKPEAAGIAFWLWNLTLYAQDFPVSDWIKELDGWIEVFSSEAPRGKRKDLIIKIKLNMIERMAGALMKDLPYRLSPLDHAVETDAARSLERIKFLCRAVLFRFLD